MTRTTELTPLQSRASSWALWPAPCPSASPQARREHLDYASFLEIILSDEVQSPRPPPHRTRLHNAGFEETCGRTSHWSASITLDRRLLDAVFSLEFLDRHEHVLLAPPVSARASSPRPWATPPSAPDTPCAGVSHGVTTSSRP